MCTSKPRTVNSSTGWILRTVQHGPCLPCGAHSDLLHFVHLHPLLHAEMEGSRPATPALSRTAPGAPQRFVQNTPVLHTGRILRLDDGRADGDVRRPGGPARDERSDNSCWRKPIPAGGSFLWRVACEFLFFGVFLIFLDRGTTSVEGTRSVFFLVLTIFPDQLRWSDASLCSTVLPRTQALSCFVMQVLTHSSVISNALAQDDIFWGVYFRNGRISARCRSVPNGEELPAVS